MTDFPQGQNAPSEPLPDGGPIAAATLTEGAEALPLTEAEIAAAEKRKKLKRWIAIIAVLLALIAALFLWYLATRKPLTQFPVINSLASPHFVTATYDLSQPVGVAIDEPNNVVYVTQSGGSRAVVILDMDGNRVGELASIPGKKKAANFLPVYVAVDPATSDVYVTDRGNAAVHVYDSSGNYLREFLPKGTTVWTPLGIAFGPTGELYVSDLTEPHQKVWELKTDGTVVRTIGEQDALSYPNGLAVLPNGALAVADSNNGRVVTFGQGMKAAGAIGRGDAETALGLPRGLAVDDIGRLYVVDTVNQLVRIYTPPKDANQPPDYATSFGSLGDQDGQFAYPNGVAVDSRDRIYVTDRENGRLQVWSY
jgi:DNA-binding beta-propeller fold protein YncE